ncbi:flagellar basal body-associated FliL family protein [Fervidobacterium sp. 2310opik-2]|uniref:flagellar basal body-associated FliL family protein n=1 Tax=Fervidobacterium sp. 2310opik-2 TaxID=1755815 RepID=UPI0013E0458F|nr:flagellar basal body-associated FliL family protein [Fervidobacterium sp. 2310opik-2]KAF2962171.1 flagellar basal body protein FliL [Fervidobacterium sp. 2310opik-2]
MPEEMEQQQEQGGKKPNPIMGILKLVGIPLIVSLVVTLAVFFLLGQNKQPQQQQEQQQVTAPTQIKAVVIQAGKFQTFMLKGGRDVVVIDSLTLLVGSEPCRAAVADKNDEIMDALSIIFLSKERFELTTPAGIDLLKKQIREAVNEITGFTGEKEKFGVINVYIYVKSISSVQ